MSSVPGSAVGGTMASSRMRRPRCLNFSQIVMYGVLLLYAVIVIGPLTWMVLSSFKRQREIILHPFGLPSNWRIDSFIAAWQSGFGTYFVNSIIVTVGAVIPMIIISGLAAY